MDGGEKSFEKFVAFSLTMRRLQNLWHFWSKFVGVFLVFPKYSKCVAGEKKLVLCEKKKYFTAERVFVSAGQ